MEMAGPGSWAASHGSVFVQHSSGYKCKRGVRSYLLTQLLSLLCASVQFRGNLHHFFPCLSGSNAHVSVLERDGSTDGSLCI